MSLQQIGGELGKAGKHYDARSLRKQRQLIRVQTQRRGIQYYHPAPSRCRQVKALHRRSMVKALHPSRAPELDVVARLPDVSRIAQIPAGSPRCRTAPEPPRNRSADSLHSRHRPGRYPFVKLVNLAPGWRPFIHAGATQECTQPTQALFRLALVLANYAECATLNPQRLSNVYFSEVDCDLVSSPSQLRRSPAPRRCGGDDRIAAWKIPDHGRHRTSNRTHTATEQPR
jgi:hypothetical protein